MTPKDSSIAARLARAVARAAASLSGRRQHPVSDEASALVIDLAAAFTRLADEAAPGFTTAYLRFAAEGARFGSTASCVTPAGAALVDAVAHRGAFGRLNAFGARLLRSLGRETGVVLLVIDAARGYEIRFEHQDLGRWRISRRDGGTGVPEGL
jgi:hypothetical protein